MVAVVTPCSVKLWVREIPKNEGEWVFMAQKAAVWRDVAAEKLSKGALKKVQSHQFRSAANIAAVIHSEIMRYLFPETGEDEAVDKRWNSLFVCFSKEKIEIEGMALFCKGTGYLKAVVSHPKNIKHDLNDPVERISGVGSAIIRALAERCIEIDRPLTLSSFKTAREFYERLGFKYVEAMPSPVLSPMILPLEGCRAMVEGGGG